MKLVVNLIFLLILLLCAWNGFRKGLIMGIGGILVIIISLYFANLLSTTYSYEVVDALRPFASGYMETTINRSVRPEFHIEGAVTGSLSVEDYLAAHPEDAEAFRQSTFEHLGFYAPTAEQLSRESAEYVATHENVSISDAMVEVLCLRATYVLGFILFFLMILIVLTVLGNIPNLGFKIPDMDLLNDIGGLVTGLIQGFLFCSVLAWSLKFIGIIYSQENLAGSFLAAAFMRVDLLSRFLGI